VGFKLTVPTDRIAPERVLDAHIQQTSKQMEIGVMGRLFGDAVNKPGNIAGFAIILAFSGILVAAFAPVSADFPRRELLTSCISIITGALGFVFGNIARRTD
jgi:hypothetical protein